MGGTKTAEQHETVSRGASQLLERALKSGASDIHIEPRAALTVVRYRRGSQLMTGHILPKSAAPTLARYFKKLANLNTGQRAAPQSGAGEIEVEAQPVSFELTVLPTQDGEKLTVHLPPSPAAASLADLGFWGEQLTNLEHALASPRGLITVAAPRLTDNRQLVTSLLQMLAMAGGTVVMLDEEAAPTVASIKLADTAIGHKRMLARIADNGYGEVVGLPLITSSGLMKLALDLADKTLVIAGVPALGAVRGLEFALRAGTPADVASTLRAAIGFATLPGLCEQCREAYRPGTDELAELNRLFHLSSKVLMHHVHKLELAAANAGIGSDDLLSSTPKTIARLWQPHTGGCTHCLRTGYAAPGNVAELCLPSDEFRARAVHADHQKDLQKLAVKNGMLTLPIDGLIKALRGEITAPAVVQLYRQYKI